ncbi:putative C6 transcription factor [Talaromyces proteolyticus]|uniref:C6 transcription factor n=1 Tax=Talaromyces proteolyticus TaxID=1131652 RepID=A0AAD4KF64_9EURO|nr:putative C6 transcription factor [Talaromyces proteolyticus]KAH8690839.1 putative C6 transcription factor [Talaromyces proteolyticus]
MTSAPSETESQNKRKASTAGLSSRDRPVKRRASRACCCCRARKVRCDVVENGSPCTNCRLDQVECVVMESKRRKKSRVEAEVSKPSPESPGESAEDMAGLGQPGYGLDGLEQHEALSPSQRSVDLDMSQHMPHLIYQSRGSNIDAGPQQSQRRSSVSQPVSNTFNLGSNVTDAIQQLLGSPRSRSVLPDYIRGLPQRLQRDDVEYLSAKGALTIPDTTLRNELLKAYIHYVHPYMPLLDLEEFLQVIARNDGIHRMSLLLFQAVMFAGTAFVDNEHLVNAGYSSRKVARKVFFQRARLLYDFDYEVDRISLVQSLLLMTYWYETPDDQKDTWHWMGVSLSLAHTIGLHRDPSNSGMGPRRKQMWKRIWWSTYTRDRLIALGMRRPMRVKDDDCDVPMLTIDDFEFKSFPSEVLSMLGDCEFLYNIEQQRHLAMMFIEKSKLCLCVSNVLSAQYSVLSHRFGGTTETTMMLVPKKSNTETFQVRTCDEDLERWQANLPAEIQYKPQSSKETLSPAESSLHLHRALLRMIYLTTSSALHRPQVLPASPFPTVEAELQEVSRNKVRRAAVEITNIAQGLHKLDLTRYLPTAGVTVLLPAVIIHLLDIKSNDPSIRMVSLQRFYQCMRILQRLREIYASADFATSFLEAAIRKAGIQLNLTGMDSKSSAPPGTVRPTALTPPPDSLAQKLPDLTYPQAPTGFRIPEMDSSMPFNAATPPHSDGSENGSLQNLNPNIFNDENRLASQPNLSLSDFIGLANDAEVTQNDFDALLNYEDANNDLFGSDESMDLGMSMDNHDQDKADFDMNEFTADGHILGYELNKRSDGISMDFESDLGFALRL